MPPADASDKEDARIAVKGLLDALRAEGVPVLDDWAAASRAAPGDARVFVPSGDLARPELVRALAARARRMASAGELSSVAARAESVHAPEGDGDGRRRWEAHVVLIEKN